MTKTATIDFEITSTTDAKAMYIAGDHESLGNWVPDAVSLELSDGIWKKTLHLPKNTWQEFKITDGSWNKEALISGAPDNQNLRLFVHEDQQVKLNVEKWQSHAPMGKDTVRGQVDHLGIQSYPGLKNREVIVWLPSAYIANPTKSFPVLYANDGQNMVDRNTAFLNNDWRADDTIERMAAQNHIDPPIMVCIYNTDDRLEEYNDTELGRRYLAFIVHELKPFIDKHYRTKKNPANTAIIGSSMGGLISFLAAWYHPNVFGQAACLSPMFWGKTTVQVKTWKMVENHPKHELKAKLYIDNGTVELERKLMPGCKKMLRVLRSRGYKKNKNLLWFVDDGAWHNEHAWAERLWRPLEYFYGKKSVVK
jgi:enterochelin esterase-like enzyme